MKEQYAEIFMNSPKLPVWDEIVEPGHLFMALFGVNIDSSFKKGGRIELSGTQDGAKVIHIYGKILEFAKGPVLSNIDHPGPSVMPDN